MVTRDHKSSYDSVKTNVIYYEVEDEYYDERHLQESMKLPNPATYVPEEYMPPRSYVLSMVNVSRVNKTDVHVLDDNYQPREP